MTYNR